MKLSKRTEYGLRAAVQLARLWPRVRPYRGMLLVATVALVLSSLASLAFPMVVRYLLDAAFVNRDRALLDRIALGLVALFCVQAVLNYIQAYLLSATGEQAVAGHVHGQIDQYVDAVAANLLRQLGV